MKKQILIFLSICMSTVLMACNTTNNDNVQAEGDDVAVVEDEAGDSSVDTEESDDSTDSADSSVLPEYEYPGPEYFYSKLYQYMILELGANYDSADVTIPCPIITYEDDLGGGSYDVYGDFWIDNYNLNGDVLEFVSGGSYPGVIHMLAKDDGYDITMEVVGDGSGFEESAKQIFGDYYDDFMKIYSDYEYKQQVRAQIIANYVAANDLDIVAFQDYGADPVELPEENIDNFYSILD